MVAMLAAKKVGSMVGQTVSQTAVHSVAPRAAWWDRLTAALMVSPTAAPTVHSKAVLWACLSAVTTGCHLAVK